MLGWSAISTVLPGRSIVSIRPARPSALRNVLLALVGYGPLLCAISVGAIIAQLRNADLKWDKTIKSGKARLPT